MSDTLKYGIKESLKWIWIAFIAGAICAGFLWQKNSGENDKTYSGGWDTYPEAHRYALYTSEIKPEIFLSGETQLNLFSVLNSYNELIKQHIMSIQNKQYLYQLFIKRFPQVYPAYKVDKFEEEMIGVYWNNTTELVVYTNSPKIFDSSKFSNELLCEMRDYVSAKLVELVENDEYIKTFPIQLKRAAIEEESTLSEQLLIAEVFKVREGTSIKKMLAAFAVTSVFVYLVIVLMILANGKIKTAEELEQMTNLKVFDELTRLKYDEAIKIIRTKLKPFDSDDTVYLISDNSSSAEEASKIAEDLDEQVKTVQWKEEEGIIQVLKNHICFLLIKQNRTRKKDLRFLARELSQINARCAGSIVVK